MAAVSYMRLPLSKNRWMYRVFVNGEEITNDTTSNGLAWIDPSCKKAVIYRWADCSLVHTVMQDDLATLLE